MDNGLKVGGVNVNERGLVILSFLLFLTQIRLKCIKKRLKSIKRMYMRDLPIENGCCY